MLNVWADGHYSIAMLYGGSKYSLVASDDPHPAIRPGLAENQLHFECVDDTFVIAANGQEVVRYVDDMADFYPGQVILYGCTCRGGAIDVAFSHVRITFPEAPQTPAPPRGLPTRVFQAAPPGSARKEAPLAIS